MSAGILYIIGILTWISVGLTICSARHHMGKEVDDFHISLAVVGGLVWPFLLIAYVLVGAGWGIHKLIGVLVRKMFGPRIEVRKPVSIEDINYYDEANREVEALLGEVPESEMLMSGSIDSKEFVNINRIRYYTMTDVPSE